jgi:hypothetical protein
MATTLNRVELIGRLGADPDVKELAQGVVCTFSVATHTPARRDGQVGRRHRTVAGARKRRALHHLPRRICRSELVGHSYRTGGVHNARAWCISTTYLCYTHPRV